MAPTPKQITEFMHAAEDEAQMAGIIGEVPIGAVVVHDGKIVGRGHNLREHSQNGTHHAEMMAIEEACLVLHTWRLEECDLYVTLEPCPMCAGAMINSRVRTCYWGAADPKAGAAGTLVDLLTDTRFNHQVGSVGGVDADISAKMLQDFFRGIRAKRKAAKKQKQAAAAASTTTVVADPAVAHAEAEHEEPEITGLAVLKYAAKLEAKQKQADQDAKAANK